MNIIRVLVIEDSKSIADMLVISINNVRRMTYTFVCESVGSIKEAEVRLNDKIQFIDVVLLDLTLPNGSGLEAFLQIHNACIQPSRAIPIVVLTDDDSPEREIEIMNLGAQAFLRKSDFTSNFFKVEHLATELYQAILRFHAVRDTNTKYADMQRAIISATMTVKAIVCQGNKSGERKKPDPLDQETTQATGTIEVEDDSDHINK